MRIFLLPKNCNVICLLVFKTLKHCLNTILTLISGAKAELLVVSGEKRAAAERLAEKKKKLG